MIYDRDLKWINRATLMLMALNLGMMIGNAVRHEWLNSVAFLIWFCNLCVWRGMNKGMQRTRDSMRLTDAAVLKALTNAGME